MSKIIVGFDFSKGSAYAVDLAIDIANHVQTDLRLVYVKEKNEDEAPIRAEIERRNAAVEPLLKGIKLEYVIRQGKVHSELSAQAVEDDALMIVVGSHGMSGFERNWIGRNTYRTIADSPVPVLTIREDFKFNKALERIVVPIDSSADTRQKVPYAAKMAKLFGSELVVLGLYTSSNKDIRNIVNGYVRMVDTFLTKGEVHHTCKFVEAPKNLTATTLDYAESISADLIVIMTEQESTLTSFLLGTYAQQMLTLSRIPILTLRPEQINGLAK